MFRRNTVAQIPVWRHPCIRVQRLLLLACRSLRSSSLRQTAEHQLCCYKGCFNADLVVRHGQEYDPESFFQGEVVASLDGKASSNLLVRSIIAFEIVQERDPKTNGRIRRPRPTLHHQENLTAPALPCSRPPFALLPVRARLVSSIYVRLETEVVR